MSFKDFEKSLQGLKNVTEAPKLRERIKELEQKLAQEETRNKQRLQDKEKEIEQLLHVISLKNVYMKELEEPRIRYKKDQYSPKEFRALIKAEVDKYIKKQIQVKAKKLAEKLLPKYVTDEISRYPERCAVATKQMIENQAKIYRDFTLLNPSTWPPLLIDKVEERANALANQIMNEEFEKKVSRQAWYELNKLIEVYWPKQLTEKVTPFIQSSLRSQLLKLTHTIHFDCGRCGASQYLTMVPNDIATLLKKSRIIINCIHCQKRISLTLGELLWTIVNNDDVGPPTRIIKGIKYEPVKSTKKDKNLDKNSF
jgi:hypothetical protein